MYGERGIFSGGRREKTTGGELKDLKKYKMHYVELHLRTQKRLFIFRGG